MCVRVELHQVKAGFTVTMQGCYSWNLGHEGQPVGGLMLLVVHRKSQLTAGAFFGFLV